MGIGAGRLMMQGKRVGVITNDQASDLVDTALLKHHGLNVEEVSGSCFCCNFGGLIRAADRLKRKVFADVLIAEPVGSCTDLSATLVQPIKMMFEQEFTQSPLTVLADPFILKDILDGDLSSLHPSTRYIYQMQLEEADIIALNKIDLLEPEDLSRLEHLMKNSFPRPKIRFLSSLFGHGIDDWLEEIMASECHTAGVVEVDYRRYAEGELRLAWLNAEIRLSGLSGAVDWRCFCSSLLDTLCLTAQENAMAVGHIKLFLTTENGHLTASLTGNGKKANIRDDLKHIAIDSRLILNARVDTTPEALKIIVEDAIEAECRNSARFELRRISSTRPGIPHPTHRILPSV
jgi:Ni2+-binding GTPase involved in maturation of urease and hydrogenase